MKGKQFLSILVLVLVFAAIWAFAGLAQEQTPEGVDIYYPVDGWFCMRDTELGIHICEFIDPCCEGEVACPDCPTCPDPTPNPTPNPTPDPTPDPTPIPTEKPKCNRGLGNGSENCDPGNSGGKPGSAGEDNE